MALKFFFLLVCLLPGDNLVSDVGTVICNLEVCCCAQGIYSNKILLSIAGYRA